METPEQKLSRIEHLVQEWMDKQGHERCWYYPDLFRQIADVLEIEANIAPALPPREEFEHGCRRYQDEEYGKKRGL